MPGKDEELCMEDIDSTAEAPIIGIDTEADSEYYEVFVPYITPRQAVYDFCTSKSFKGVRNNIANYVMDVTGPFALVHKIRTDSTDNSKYFLFKEVSFVIIPDDGMAYILKADTKENQEYYRIYK